MKKYLILFPGALLLAVLFSSCIVEHVPISWSEYAKKKYAASLYDASMTVLEEEGQPDEVVTVEFSGSRMFYADEDDQERESVLLKEAEITFELGKRLTIHSTGTMAGFTMDFVLDVEYFDTTNYEIHELTIDGQDVDKTWFVEYAGFEENTEGEV